MVWLGSADIRPCCTLERHHPNGGISRTVAELLTLAMVESDNTAADALLKLVGGAEVVQRRLRSMGFEAINVDRSEGQLLLDMAGVTNAPPPDQWTVELQRRLVADVDRVSLSQGRVSYLSDERDTATPAEMARLLGRLQLGDLLPPRRRSCCSTSCCRRRPERGASKDVSRLTRSSPIKQGRRPSSSTTRASSRCRQIARSPGMWPSRSSSQMVTIAAMERSVAAISAAAFEFFTGKAIPLPQPSPRKMTKPATKTDINAPERPSFFVFRYSLVLEGAG